MKARTPRGKDKTYTHDELLEMDIETLDMMAFGYTSGQVVVVNPKDITIIYTDLENPEYRYQREGDHWLKSVSLEEPVEVSIREDGKLSLEDGHHRWFAASKRGLMLKAIVEVKANPIKAILARQAAKLVRPHEGGLEP
jgi:hypothetical protein